MNLTNNKTFIDQMGREISLPNVPKRIISLVPSQTELLYDLGLMDEIVGQTLFCVHPKEMHALKPRIGGTKKLNLNKIRALKPDLIIGNKEENTKEDIEILMKEFPVWMSDIQNLEQAIKMILDIGDLVNRKEESIKITQQIEGGFKKLVQTDKEGTCIYLIWREPFMAAGEGTFINDMLKKLSLKNLAVTLDSRYPDIPKDWMSKQNPNYIFLSSEPYPFVNKHIEELKTICPNADIRLVNGELFSWYGSRLIKSATYFEKFLT